MLNLKVADKSDDEVEEELQDKLMAPLSPLPEPASLTLKVQTPIST